MITNWIAPNAGKSFTTHSISVHSHRPSKELDFLQINVEDLINL
jgi:hypothetical protein